MATLGELRTAIVDRLTDSLPGDWTVYRLPPDSIEAPAIMVMGFEVSPGSFGEGTHRVAVELLVAASRRHVDQVDALDEVLSPTGELSLWQVFDEDPSLGGVVGGAMVATVGEYRQLVVADVGYYGATVQVTVML